MNSLNRHPGPTWNSGPSRTLRIALAGIILVLQGLAFASSSAVAELQKNDRPFFYFNDVLEEVPWSIHIVRIARSHKELEFCTTLGGGQVFGMNTVPEQLKMLPHHFGQPLAAINGDFWDASKYCVGRPRDVQLWGGEVVSSPAGDTCFWIDRDGNPQMTNVFSEFKVIWEDGKTTPVGLNQDRDDDAAVLYTSVVGGSTHTRGGLELALEPATNSTWLPLKIGAVYAATVSSVRIEGNTPLARASLVLSIGPNLAAQIPACRPGTKLRFATETVPDLAGAQVAIGGGPALVHEGHVMRWNGIIHARHPRSAVGWNKEHIFLVEVDGRQGDLSVGMTFPELADYLVNIGCEEAMNFDGGGSATLWVLGAVRNSPSEGRERPAPNALVVVKKREAGP